MNSNPRTSMIELQPTILTDQLDVAQKLLEISGKIATRFTNSQIPSIVPHIDIIDPDYVDNLTLDPFSVKELRLPTSLSRIDIHLMTVEPQDVIEELVPSLPIRFVLGQIEKMSRPDRFVEMVRERGWQPGFAVDLFTQAEALQLLLEYNPEAVLVMQVRAGFQGQVADPRQLDVVRSIRSMLPSSIPVIADGGMSSIETIQSVIDAGAQQIAIGSHLWTADDPVERYCSIVEAIKL